MIRQESHSVAMGYILWIFGFMGMHRFYYGKPISGTIYFFTLGLVGIGWLVGVFLLGILYDLWTMNEQLSLINTSA
ncbi:MAG: TM2 domain-containing protein [Candidatus Electrothrix sp. AW3_4]|nr:TM2 domain-containing protein [Candidatus Electrothrix gigas]